MNYEQLKSRKNSLERELHNLDSQIDSLELEERTREILDQINRLKDESYEVQKELVIVINQMKKLA